MPLDTSNLDHYCRHVKRVIYIFIYAWNHQVPLEVEPLVAYLLEL